MRWAPALAAACLLADRHARESSVPRRRMRTGSRADAQLFSDVYSMEQSTEPRAAAPIHALFEENQ